MPFLPAILGGLLIGAGAALLYAGVGRTAGLSGLTYGFVWPAPGTSRLLPALFLGGLVAGGFLAAAVLPLPPAELRQPMLLIVSGLLVGFGTRLGNGCTSGHGICGLARLSPRSAVAVFVFMLAGMLAASLLRGWTA